MEDQKIWSEDNATGSNIPRALRLEVFYYIKHIRLPHEILFDTICSRCPDAFFGEPNRGIRTRTGRLIANLMRATSYNQESIKYKTEEKIEIFSVLEFLREFIKDTMLKKNYTFLLEP